MSGVVTYWRIAEGNTGVIETLTMMIGMMRSSAPRVRARAERILRDAHAYWLLPRPRTVMASDIVRAHVVYTWVQQRMRYVQDANEAVEVEHGRDRLEEELRSADVLLRDIEAVGFAEGDCDDYVILMGSLLLALDVPFTIEVVSSRADRIFDHVYLALLDGTVLDAITGQPFGWSVGAVTNHLTVPV